MRRPWNILSIGLLLFALLPTTALYAARSQPPVVPLTAVNPIADGPKVRLFIQAELVDETDLIDTRRRLIAAGVKNVNLFVREKVIACEAPRSIDVQALIGDSRYNIVNATSPIVAAAARAGAT
ncbi:MAG: hypothetical protein JSW50_09465, partial [Candidatus Latescibacterota bacterium]